MAAAKYGNISSSPNIISVGNYNLPYNLIETLYGWHILKQK